MDRFISCDWGTTNLRLRLVNTGDLSVVAEENSSQGIAGTYALWQQQHEKESGRGQFYFSVLADQLKSLSKKSGFSLDHIPLILSGMASSSIGMKELAYKELPFHIDGSDLQVAVLHFNHGSNDVIIISGARTDSDVMRGEETKVVGAFSFLGDVSGEQILLMPGTHSKHVTIKEGRAIDFSTYMTGEFFDLLSSKSILSGSVQSTGELDEKNLPQSFADGVILGSTSNLLHAAFMVRTNQLLRDLSPEHDYYYLSGLLIGAELGSLRTSVPVTIVGNSALTALYEAACSVLSIAVKSKINGDLAVMSGQRTIFSKHFL